MRYLIIFAIAFGMLGCSTPKHYQIKHTEFKISLVVDASAPNWGKADIYTQDGRVLMCKITLKRYPACLLHEIRHCIEGDFHQGTESAEDC